MQSSKPACTRSHSLKGQMVAPYNLYIKYTATVITMYYVLYVQLYLTNSNQWWMKLESQTSKIISQILQHEFEYYPV